MASPDWEPLHNVARLLRKDFIHMTMDDLLLLVTVH